MMSTPYALHSVRDSLGRTSETEEEYANITTEASSSSGDQEESKVSRKEENVNHGDQVGTIEHNMNGPETEEGGNVSNATLAYNQSQTMQERMYLRLLNAGRIVPEMELRDEEECAPLSLADRLLRDPNNHLHPLGLCAYIYVWNNEGQHVMYNLPFHLNAQKQLVVLVQDGELFNVPFRIERVARRFNSPGAIPVVVLKKWREVRQIKWRHSFAFSRRYVSFGENDQGEDLLEILWSTSLIFDPGQSELELSRICSYCLKRAPRGRMFKRCSRCKRVWFCSTACHLLAWDIFHSVLCGAVELCNERARQYEQHKKEQQEQFRFNFPNELSNEQQEQGRAFTITEMGSEKEEKVVRSEDQGNQVVSRDDQRNQKREENPPPVPRGVQSFRSAVAGGLQPVHEPIDEVQLAADIEAMNLNEVLNGEVAIVSNKEEEEESYRRQRAELDTVD